MDLTHLSTNLSQYTLLRAPFNFTDLQWRLVKLALKYGPQLRFHSDEEYFPSTPNEHYLPNCELRQIDSEGRDSRVAFPATMEDLANFKTNFGSSMGYLKIANESIRTGNLHTAAPSDLPARIGIHVLQRGDDQFDIQYWIFYPWNGSVSVKVLLSPNFEIPNKGEHEGDWEHITVRVGLDDDQIRAIYFAAHGDKGAWAFPSNTDKSPQFQVTSEGRPIVWVALHSHACYWDSDDHTYVSFPLDDITGGLVDRPNDDGIRWDTGYDFDSPSASGGHLQFLGFTGQDISIPGIEPVGWLMFEGLWGDAHRTNDLTTASVAQLTLWGGGPLAPLIAQMMERDGSGPTGPTVPDSENFSVYFDGDK